MLRRATRAPRPAFGDCRGGQHHGEPFDVAQDPSRRVPSGVEGQGRFRRPRRTMTRPLLISLVVGMSLVGSQGAAASRALCQSSQRIDCCCAAMEPACGMCSTTSHPAATEELVATTPSSKMGTFSPTSLASVAPAGKTARVTAAPCRSRDVSRAFHASPPATYLLDCVFRL